MRQTTSSGNLENSLAITKKNFFCRLVFIACFIGLLTVYLSNSAHAIEKKSYPDLSSRLLFRGSNRLCTYQISYKGAVLKGGKTTLSSQSSFKSEKLSGKRFFVRHALFPLSISDFIKLIRGDEAAVNNKNLVKAFLTRFFNTKNLADLNLQSKKLSIVMSSFNKLNPLGKNLPRTKIIAGIYLSDTSQGNLFALASIKPKIFGLTEICGATPPKLIRGFGR